MIDVSKYMQVNSMKPNDPPKAYGRPQVRKVMTFEQFVSHLADHNTTYSRGTFKGVVSDACKCVVEQLLAGNKIMFGELGEFWLSISCNPAKDLESFTASNITSVNIVFTPGPDFENLIDKADFNFVVSRKAQDAIMKAMISGARTLDLTALMSKTTAEFVANQAVNAENGDEEDGGDTSTDPTDGGTTPTGGGSDNGGGDNGGGDDPDDVSLG